MRTCGTCRYFGPVVTDLMRYDADYQRLPTKYHACELLQHRMCVDVQGADPEQTSGAAVVIDGSDYHAVFCVSEEFGCNQHAEKDAT